MFSNDDVSHYEIGFSVGRKYSRADRLTDRKDSGGCGRVLKRAGNLVSVRAPLEVTRTVTEVQKP